MDRLYTKGELQAMMSRMGVVDRYYRFGHDTWEAHVTLSLHSQGGRVPMIRLALRLLWQEQREAMWQLLAEYPFDRQREAHMDAVTVAAKLGLSVLVEDADDNWHIVFHPDIDPVVEPGSIVLWED